MLKYVATQCILSTCLFHTLCYINCINRNANCSDVKRAIVITVIIAACLRNAVRGLRQHVRNLNDKQKSADARDLCMVCGR
jgi:hypothetical protein